MKIRSLGLKVSLIVAIMLALTVGVIVYIVSIQSNDLVIELSSKQVGAANTAFAQEMQRLQNDAFARATAIANSNEVVNAMLYDDGTELKQILINLGAGFDTVTVVDVNGDVIMRGHSDSKGDSLMYQKAVSSALNNGTGIGSIEKGSTVGLSARGSCPVKNYNGNIIGAVVCSYDLSKPNYVDNVKASTNSEATIFDGSTRLSTTIVDEKNERVVGTEALPEVVEAVIDRGEDYTSQIVLFNHNYYSYYSPLVFDGETIGMLFTGVVIDDALTGQRSMMNTLVVVGIVCGLISIALIIIFNFFSVTRPLRKIGAFAQKISSGDIGISSSTSATTGVTSADEVGALAKDLEQAYNNLRGYVGEIRERMQAMSDGDLASESDFAFHGDFVLIKDSINGIIRKLNQIMSEVNRSSTQVSNGAKQIADGSQALAQGSIEQAATINELANSATEISQNTKDNTDMAEKAADLAEVIRGNAEKGSRQMSEMIEAVNAINQSSKNINNIIKVIDDIAFQTNILALNAAVEAARAGQHGKGFAVVADEVRNLASKSAEAARDTGAMIQDSIEKAELGSRIAEETAASLQEIVSGINESSQLVADIAKGSEEQLLGITQINDGIDKVSQVIQQNSATAQESAAASQEMSGQSDMLQEMITQFKLK